MAEDFDPYYKWLGILPKDQPPHNYRLLGIELFEEDLCRTKVEMSSGWPR